MMILGVLCLLIGLLAMPHKKSWRRPMMALGVLCLLIGLLAMMVFFFTGPIGFFFLALALYVAGFACMDIAIQGKETPGASHG